MKRFPIQPPFGSILFGGFRTKTIWSYSKQSSFVMWDFGFDLMYAYASRKQVSNLSSAIFYSHRSYVICIVAMTFAQPSSELRFVWKVLHLCLFILKESLMQVVFDRFVCLDQILFCFGDAMCLGDKYFERYGQRFVFIRKNIVSDSFWNSLKYHNKNLYEKYIFLINELLKKAGLTDYWY